MGVVVTWGELRPAAAGFGPEGGKQRTELARVFDAGTLEARGPGKVVGQQEAADAFSNGIAPFALADGTLGTGTCAWAAFAGRFTCRLAPAAPGPPGTFSGADYDDRGVAGPGPQGDRVAVAAVGEAAILLAPQCQDVRIFSSAGKAGLRPLAYGTADARTDCEPKRTIDAPAIAAMGSDEALGVWRHGAAIEGRRVGKDGLPRGPLFTVSAAGENVGAPAIAWTGTEARVAYAAWTGGRPTTIAFAHWKPDGAPATRATVATGNTPAMAPALASTDDAACTVISWTEGKGSGTRVRAGLACDDALVAGSVVDVSTFATEAGDSELARLGPSGAYAVVWQELPKGKPAELRLAKLICE
jgi:hypothetical protein